MTSRHLVDPELLPLLSILPQLDFAGTSLAELRAGMMAMTKMMPIVETPGVACETLMVPGPAGMPEVRLLSYRPQNAAAALPAILHIHGGGYVLGAPELNDIANRLAVRELGCALYSVDYRLAPEAPHPAPVEDCYAALKYISENAVALGLNAARIGVKGESAGGGLAACLALLAHSRGGPALAFQHLIFPMLDDRTCTTTPHPYAGEFVWTAAHNVFGWTSLLGQPPGSPEVSPYAAAARAGNLANLPPSFIATGALDLFTNENLDYARRLIQAGVPTEFHIYPGAFHGFQMGATSRIAQAAERDSLNALRRACWG